ncbi:MAG: CRISPR-associated RAMP protein Csx10 [Thermoplasmatales archaeon]|nr:CRISPR-associated RAMP protein Csx10 [Candidatus Methanoperedenaceae archaeon]MCG2826301.1 CRISPR-associated RAMP protein Csx10 [Thermoplasmatales archaeon]
MIEYISIIPQSPIHIGEVKIDFSFLPTQDMIPGSAIRGSLAEYLKLQGRTSEITDYVKEMRFGFFTPSDSQFNLSLPFPATVLSCKNKGDFKQQKGHGVFDSLLARIAYVELKRMKAEFPVPFKFKCRECDMRVDKYSGFYVKEGRVYKKISIAKSSQTKVAINRRRKAAEKEMLYSITGINPITNRKGVVFIGKIDADSEKIDFVLEALNELGIGAFSTRGFGKVQAEKKKIIIERFVNELSDRVNTFNDKLKEVWKHMHSIALNKNELPDSPEEYYFSIDLLSPAIIKNIGIPTLKLELDFNSRRINPILYSTTPIFISGWSTAWGLPKETTFGAAMGSTYAFRIKEKVESIYQILKDIEQRGVGERTDEGYGDVMICHPFHMEVEPV